MKAKDVRTYEDFMAYLKQVGAKFTIAKHGSRNHPYELVRVYNKDTELDKTYRMNVYMEDERDDWFISVDIIRPGCDECGPYDHMRPDNFKGITKEEICKRIWRLSRRRRS